MDGDETRSWPITLLKGHRQSYSLDLKKHVGRKQSLDEGPNGDKAKTWTIRRIERLDLNKKKDLVNTGF